MRIAILVLLLAALLLSGCTHRVITFADGTRYDHDQDEFAKLLMALARAKVTP